MTNITIHEQARIWSLLDPRPSFYRHSKSATVVCYWQGVAMTKRQALAIVMGCLNVGHASSRIKHDMFEEFFRAYQLGAFGKNLQWDHLLEDSASHYSLLTKSLLRRDPDLRKKLNEQYTAKQALEWFKQDNEQSLDEPS